MAARTTRQEARQRAITTFMASLEKVIPADESVPLKGGTFREWEQQTEQIKQAVIPTVLEERAALEDNAQVSSAGRCPYCASDRVYLEKQETQQELLSPDGPVLITRQHGRCRSCNRSFSPSKP